MAARLKAPQDLLGRPLGELEARLLVLYRDTKELVKRKDLPPCVAANVRASLAALYNCVNDLDLEFEHLYDLGV